MSQPLDLCNGAFMEDKLFVFNENGNNAQLFNPNTGMWKRVDNILAISWRSCLVVSGHLHVLTEGGLMKYDAQENNWISDIIPGI